MGDMSSSPITVLDALIRTRTKAGASTVGLHEVLQFAHVGELHDLPGMRADQRAPVVTALAIISHLIRRYAAVPPSTADEWRRELQIQMGDALTLVGAPADRPQFLQPVLVGDAKPLSITEVDHLMPATGHVLKAEHDASPEVALFALMTSTWRQYGGRGHYGGARARSLSVLVGDGETIGSEIVLLGAAYDNASPVVAGIETVPSELLDHMLWARPWLDDQSLAQVPFPFIDCRMVRLVWATDGRVGAVSAPMSSARVNSGTGHIDDPHVPMDNAGGVFKLVMKRTWSHRVQLAALAGSADVSRPRVLDLAPPFAAVRISGVHEGQSKTGGYWEALYRIGSGRKVKLGPPVAGDRLSTLSQAALDTVSNAEKALFLPFVTAFDDRAKDAEPHLKRAQSRLRDILGPASVQVVLDLVDEPVDTEREQAALNSMAVAGMRTVWAQISPTLTRDPIKRARATLALEDQFRRFFRDQTMTEADPTSLSARVHAVLHEIDAHLTPDNRARLRAAGRDLPLAAYSALAAVPREWTDLPEAMAVWECAVRALGTVRQGGEPLGAVLADTNYPEARITALLNASGDTLVSLVSEVVRWIVAHDVSRMSLTDLVVLGMTDALGDGAGHRAASSRIALGFARRARANKVRAA